MMASQPTQKGPFYKAASLVKYKMPPWAQDDEEIAAIEKMIETDVSFEKCIRTQPKYGNPIVSQQNVYFHGHKPLEKWTWENNEESVREFILSSLLNKGYLAIKQKERLHENISLIRSRTDRARAWNECKVQLIHTWSLLDAFASFDYRVSLLRNNVGFAYDDDPNLDRTVERQMSFPTE